MPLVATGLALLALAATRRLTFSRTRLVLFAAMGACAALSQAVCAGPVSLASLAYLLALYLVYTVRLELDGERLSRGLARLCGDDGRCPASWCSCSTAGSSGPGRGAGSGSTSSSRAR